MRKKVFLCIIIATCSLLSPILFILCVSKFSNAPGEITYYFRVIMMAMLFLGFDGVVMCVAAKIPKGLEKSGCLLLTTAIIGVFGILFWLGFFIGD